MKSVERISEAAVNPTSLMCELRSHLDRHGFAILPNVIELEALEKLIPAIHIVTSKVDFAGLHQPHLAIPAVNEIAHSPAIQNLVQPLIGPGARLVRSIFFDKRPESNWGVPWHQDLTIAVREKRDAPGFTGWSQKEGVHHVQAPRAILEQILTLRLHLDDCGPDNGPLNVLPGTHTSGWLDSEAVARLKTEVPEHMCLVPVGGGLLMNPLLLHSSARAQAPSHRRVVHFEFCAARLPYGLDWPD